MNYGLENVLIGRDTIERTDLIRRRWLDNDFYGSTFSLNYQKMKNIFVLAIFLGAATAINHRYDPAAEFAARRQELKEIGSNKEDVLTDKWLRRVDSYDPDIDQEMATEVMNAQKRVEAIRRLKAKKGSINSWYADFDETSQMLKTLEKEQAEYEAKNGAMDILPE